MFQKRTQSATCVHAAPCQAMKLTCADGWGRCAVALVGVEGAPCSGTGQHWRRHRAGQGEGAGVMYAGCTGSSGGEEHLSMIAARDT